MYTIKQAADKLGLNPNALRFYEKKGLIHPIRKENEYRYYSVEDISKLQLITLYRKMGFSLEAIDKILQNKSESLLDLFASQYNIMNEHIHTFAKVRESIGDCMNELFEHNQITEKMMERMERTADLISNMNQWEDRWNFDDWATSYDKVVKSDTKGLAFYKNYTKVIKTTADKVNEKQGKIIEIGIGTGNLVLEVLKQNSVNLEDVIGVDQSVNMLRVTKKKIPKLNVKVGTFLKLPFEDNVCDTIVTSYAFHHCNDKEKELAIHEMDRVLRHKGRIIITDLMFENSTAREKFVKKCTKEELRDVEDEYFGYIDELEKILTSMGYCCNHQQIDELIWILVAEK